MERRDLTTGDEEKMVEKTDGWISGRWCVDQSATLMLVVGMKNQRVTSYRVVLIFLSNSQNTLSGMYFVLCSGKHLVK